MHSHQKTYIKYIINDECLSSHYLVPFCNNGCWHSGRPVATTWLKYHIWQHQEMTTRIITFFKVDHPMIFNFLLDDPKVSWDTWVTPNATSAICWQALKIARERSHEVLLARLLAGFWLHRSVIQRFKTKHKNIDKQQPPLCSVSLPHLHYSSVTKRARYQSILLPEFSSDIHKLVHFWQGNVTAVDWHYIEFTWLSDHIVTNAMQQK